MARRGRPLTDEEMFDILFNESDLDDIPSENEDDSVRQVSVCTYFFLLCIILDCIIFTMPVCYRLLAMS